MKELSIEDKAKRYDEAIIKFKPIYDLAKEQGRTIDVKEFENIFPELKKFEDDDIKKWLIGYFNQYIIDDMPQVFGNGLNVKDVIAWLEKQGEQKSIEWSGKIGVKHAEGKLKEMLDRKENPAWSEEDEKMFKSALWHIKNSCGNGGKNSGEFEVYNWVKSLKERVQPQPKQEWSEEDNTFFKAIIRDIENIQNISEDAKKDRINWLTNLKDRFTWKPSDEQMEALDVFIYAKYPNIEKYGAAVKSLYQDLKKLIGE